MKAKKLVLAMMLCASLVACGGSSGGGGGGGLPAATVKVLYQLTTEGSPTQQALGALLEYLGTHCTAIAADLAFDSGDQECLLGGTWRLTGTVNCTLGGTPTNLHLTITSMTGTKFSLTACASLVSNVDTNGDGASDTTSVILAGDISPFALDNTTVDATFPPADGTDPTSIVLNGRATVTYTNMSLTGDMSATISFTNQYTFANFDFLSDTNLPTCASNVVSATQSGDSGQCTIQSDCNNCI